MSKPFQLVRLQPGNKDGEYAGRVFIQSAFFLTESLAALKEIGAERKGDLWLLPQAVDTADVTARLSETAERDLARKTADRIPVSAEVAATLQDGQDFDFGPGVGVKPIAGIGQAFPVKSTGYDARLQAYEGQQVAWVHHANPPAKRMTDEEKAAVKEAKAKARAEARAAKAAEKPQLTEEQKAALAAKRQEAVAKRDETRVLVKVSDVAAGKVGVDKPVTAKGADHVVTWLGAAFPVKDKEHAARLMERDEDAPRLKAGDMVQYANWGEPAAEKTADEAPAAEVDENDPTVMRDPTPFAQV